MAHDAESLARDFPGGRWGTDCTCPHCPGSCRYYVPPSEVDRRSVLLGGGPYGDDHAAYGWRQVILEQPIAHVGVLGKNGETGGSFVNGEEAIKVQAPGGPVARYLWAGEGYEFEGDTIEAEIVDGPLAGQTQRVNTSEHVRYHGFLTDEGDHEYELEGDHLVFVRTRPL